MGSTISSPVTPITTKNKKATTNNTKNKKTTDITINKTANATTIPTKNTDATTITSKDTDSKDLLINECCICLYPYTFTYRAPISLPCGHTFCKQCTQEMNTKTCAICRAVLSIPSYKIKKNLALIEVLEHFKLLADDESAKERLTRRAVKLVGNLSQNAIDNFFILTYLLVASFIYFFPFYIYYKPKC
uniref:RING-type domain-containing protein n=1 Tax=Panagrellus redivivus TaxID=6233 RepID=A0A7E4V0R0_PANRE